MRTTILFALLLAAGSVLSSGQAPLPVDRLDPDIQKMIGEVSEEQIIEILKKLGSFETRNTLSNPDQPNRGIGAARQWIFDRLKSYSPRLDVQFDTHKIPKGARIWKDVELRNVLAVLPGKSDRGRWIVIAGHYDSLNLRVPPEMRSDPAKSAEIPAPGVTDNASGTACVLECARILSGHEFDATLVFAALAGEEQGLVGAHALAGRLKEAGQTIEGVLNNDIIGSVVTGNGITENGRILVFSEDPNDSASRQLARFIRRLGERYCPGFGVDLVFRHDRFGRGGDHTAFNQAGYAAVRFTTPAENYANQHSLTDSFENTSPPYIAKVTRVNIAAAAAMALAPPAPVTQASGPPAPDAQRAASRPGLSRGAGYDAVLRWSNADPPADLAGFVITVRTTTAPDWEREIWVGNVREFTLPNTPIDQFVFGVKAVDHDGHESPVSAYVATPRR